MNKNYFKIDVLGTHGYSFMVCTSETNEEAVIDLAAEKDLFQDTDDRNLCMVDALVDNNDIKHFKGLGCLYDLD